MNDSHSRPRGAPLTIGFLLGGIVAIVLVILGVFGLYRHDASQIARRETDRELTRVNLIARLMQSEVTPVADDLRLLADGDGLRAWVETGAQSALDAAIRRAQFISRRKTNYDQIRFIDAAGNERVRVNRGGEIVNAPRLQNKADRRYFIRGIALPPGGMYLSAFDLNVENGQVERPLKPALRFAVPIFDASGQRRGVYVINYVGSGLIQHLQDTAPRYAHRLRLLNAEGFWLKASRPELEWGSILPERRDASLARSDPALWREILQRPEGQQVQNGHIFTWHRTLPTEYSGVPADALQSDERYLIVASEVMPQEWASYFTQTRQAMIIVAIALILLTLTSLWLFTRWRRAMAGLRETNEALEQRVTERTADLVESNELLRDREALLEETGVLANVGGWDFDPDTGEGRWTTEIARIHGLDPAILPNKQLGLEFYPGESRQRIEAAIERSIADGTPYDLELEFISALGERKWVRTISRPVLRDGKVIRMRGALQDVTSRKLAELKLLSQLQRLHLLEHITRAIGERQDLDSILLVTLRALESEFDLDFSFAALYEPQHRTLTLTMIAPGSQSIARELRMARGGNIPIDANGLSRAVQGRLVYEPDITKVPSDFPRQLASAGLRALILAPLQIENRVFGILVAARKTANSFSSGECEFLRQLSEHVALAAHQVQLHEQLQSAYEELRNTQQAVMQQERLRVLGQMASGIAHDINNAISPIMLYTDSLLENEPTLNERTRTALMTIQQAVSDVAETVARMREFYRQRDSQADLAPVPLNDLVQQVIELTRARWETMPQERGVVIRLAKDLEGGLAPVHGAESEIREALTNLVFNAVDAMPRGGTMTVRTRSLATGAVCVEVGDTGVGMDAETRRRALEPFFTTKGERGTGLGLAMVYGTMQRHGGEIELESNPGEGTTVRLNFRISDAVAAVPADSARPRAGLKLLLVDDDPNVLKSLREALEADGHVVLTGDGGQHGIDRFRSAQREPGTQPISAVITDLGMPHVDGRAVAAAVKTLSPEMPVILLTGWGERILAEGHIPSHIDRVLSKPPRLRALREVLAELLGPAAASAAASEATAGTPPEPQSTQARDEAQLHPRQSAGDQS